MQIRHPHELGLMIQDARKRRGWSQSELGEVVGVSRQWVSLVENGKPSVEFDLVFSTLQALGYTIHLEAIAGGDEISKADWTSPASAHGPSGRTPLTRHGRPLRHGRSRPGRPDREALGDE